MQAAIYARISQDKRLGTQDEGASVQSQIEACQAFIEARGWTVGETYSDNDVSATSGAVRPAFERLLEDAPPIVVAFKQDRLSRDLVDTLRLKGSGITGYLTDGGVLDFSTADSSMLTVIRTAIDEAEGRKKSERQKLATLRDAKAGKYRGSIRPFGQNLDGSHVPLEADAVRTAARDLTTGQATFHAIARRWNAAGLLTPKTGKQGGREWTSGTVRNFYTRPRLKGFQAYEGTLYPLRDWTPLLEPGTFDQLQSLINSKRTGKRGVSYGRADAHLLTSLAKCECGRGLNVGYRKGNGEGKMYQCPTANHQTVTAPPLERLVSQHTLELLSQHDESRAERDEATNAIASLLDERRAIEATYSQWIAEALEAGLKPSLIAQRETLHAQRLSELDERLLTLRQALGVNVLHVTLSGSVTDLHEDLTGWDSLPLPQRRDLLQSLFEGIHVSRGLQGQRFRKDRITYSYTPLGQKLLDRFFETQYLP